jgi:hypothetical protein
MRIYYFEPRKDDLVLDGIWPSLQAACATHPNRTAYFQRDWTGGPNIFAGVQTCCSEDNPSALVAGISAYLAEHPSTAAITEQEYADRARRLTSMESRTADPLQANNSVAFVEEPVLLLVRHEEIKAAVREYLAKSSVLCVHWLDSIRRGIIDRNQLAIQILSTLVWLVNPDKLTPYLSLRSHAEGYLRLADREGRDIRSKFRASSDGELGRGVRTVLDQTISALECNQEVAPDMDSMIMLLRHQLDLLFFGVSTKQLKVEPLWNTSLDEDPAFRSWQMTISLVYRTLNQLGITPVERFLACYLLARAMEDRCGHRNSPLWDWETGPLDLSKSNSLDVKQSFPYFFKDRS